MKWEENIWRNVFSRYTLFMEAVIPFLIEILAWYERSGRHSLPWRNLESLSDRDRIYRVWLSEILLQQTQVHRIIPFYERILKSFPTIDALARIDYETFFPYYKGMGYYSRARNILRTAKIISEEYDWVFPESKEKLRLLPWVWKYTSEAIRAFGYGIPTLAWDTNLEKVFSRILHGSRFIWLTREEKTEIEERIFQSLWDKNSRHINAALMDWANLVDFNMKSQIVWEQYPRIGMFWTTHGAREEEKIKVNTSFPVPDARVVVFLHRDHSIYFSDPEKSTWVGTLPLDILPKVEERETYFPFILPPSESRYTREYVQEYFRNKYDLEVSVRPIQRKEYTNDQAPFITMNAQIQTGNHGFTEHKKIQPKPHIKGGKPISQIESI